MKDGGNTLPRIVRAEHIGPDATGDNIHAKRVAGYVWNPTGIDPVTSNPTGAWERMTQPGGSGALIPGTSFDYIEVEQTSGIVDTFIYKLGGTGGTTVQTIVVTYVDGTKNDIDFVEYS